MLDLDLLKENNPHPIIINKLELNEELVSIINTYWNNVFNSLLNTISQVERWQTDWLKINKKETNKEHILEMLYITQLFFIKYPKLNDLLDFEIVCIKIAIHDLWENWTWDLTADQKESLSEYELEENAKKELEYWIRLIKTLKREKINQEKIITLQEYYLNYEKNKSNHREINDYFVKFIDKYQALLFIVNHIPEFKNFEKYSINKIFQELKKRNSYFQEKWINLLKNFESIIDKDEVNENDIEKCL